MQAPTLTAHECKKCLGSARTTQEWIFLFTSAGEKSTSKTREKQLWTMVVLDSNIHKRQINKGQCMAGNNKNDTGIRTGGNTIIIYVIIDNQCISQ